MSKRNDLIRIPDQAGGSIEPAEETAITSDDQAELDRVVEQMELLRQDPREGLRLAALGLQRVDQRHIAGVLSRHLLELDGQVETTHENIRLFTEMVFPRSKPRGRRKKLNMGNALDILQKLTHLSSSQLGDLRKTADLLDRLTAPRRPRIHVQAAVTANEIKVGY